MDDITVEIEEAERSMLLVQIGTPAGAIRVVGQVVGKVSMRDGVLMDQEAHIQGLWPGALGRAGLNAIGWKLPEVADARAVVIEGRARTPGRNAGAIPRPIRFPR